MLIEISPKQFKHLFPNDPHPFISEEFLILNKEKVDKIVRLVEDQPKVHIGLVAGIKDGIYKTSYSSPFGGFHYRRESIQVSTIEQFLEELIQYFKNNNIKKANLSLPPSLYQESFNAKIINAFIRLGFTMQLPEITSWIDLNNFNGRFSTKSSREFYNQAVRNKLQFNILSDIDAKRAAYDLVKQNRARYNRPIYMDFDNILSTGKLWPVDFFGVTSATGKVLSAMILYRFPNKIVYAVLSGDTEEGRKMRAVDFLFFKIIDHYKSEGFWYIDEGRSTESGMPNGGLLRFKEEHEAVSSLRFSFTWEL
jgi:hypothetical protein